MAIIDSVLNGKKESSFGICDHVKVQRIVIQRILFGARMAMEFLGMMASQGSRVSSA
jgi:hypothetical protein